MDSNATSAQPTRRGHALLAWGIIVGIVVLALLRDRLPIDADDAPAGTSSSSLALVVFELQARNLVGFHELAGDQAADIWRQAESLNQGALDQRLRFVAITNELAGPEQALLALEGLNDQIKAANLTVSADDRATLDILGRLLRQYDAGFLQAPTVSTAERAYLSKRLGWPGDVVLHPAPSSDENKDPQKQAPPGRDEVIQPAVMTALAMTGGILVLFGLAFFGAIGGIIFLTKLNRGQLKSGIEPPIGYAGIYAETFALWLVMGIVGLYGAPMLLKSLAIPVPRAWSVIAFFFSLAALAWPTLRGIPFHQVRKDIGWTAGTNVFWEILVGVGCYVMAVPILMVGLLATLLLILATRSVSVGPATDAFAQPDLPAHPIIEVLAHGDWSSRMMILLLAAIAAPIVEETMFRGVLFRQLRESTRAWGWTPSFLVSALLNSVVFALIHPQGFLAAPVLTAAGLAMTCAREWRGTLIPSMVIHAFNNTLVTTWATLMFM